MLGPWFFHPNLQIGENLLCEEESRHALGSQRLHAGDELVLFDGLGNLAQGRLTPIAEDRARRPRAASARVQVVQVVPLARPRRRLSLIVAGCKGPRLPWMIEKCTELGVSNIALTVFERSAVDPSESRLEKLRKIAIEACKQSHRAWLPTIETGLTLSGVLAAARTRLVGGVADRQYVAGAAGSRLYLADPSPAARRAADVLTTEYADENSASDASGEHVAVIIGPEGGLTPPEIEQIIAAGAERVRLGAHVLRVETAAIATAAVWASIELTESSGHQTSFAPALRREPSVPACPHAGPETCPHAAREA